MKKFLKVNRIFIVLFLTVSFSNIVFAQIPVPAAIIGPGSQVPIYGFTLVGGGDDPSNLTDIKFTTTGTYTVGAAGDITSFALWYSTYNVFDDNAIQISTVSAPVAAGNQTFAAFTGLSIPTSVSYYFWITANVATTATAGRTIAVNPAIPAGNLTYEGGGDLTVTAAGGATYTVGATITTGPVNNPICADSVISIPFTANGTFPAGNVFTAQLSNAAGSFAAPVTIGTFTSTTSGTITGTIPAGTAAGTGYLIMVTSSTPAITGSTNSNGAITINTPMTYATSTVTAVTGNASINCGLPNAILQLAVTVSGDCSPQTLTQINFNTTGSTNPGTDISKAQVYYSGQTPGFTTSEQFGSDVFAPIGTFSVTGTQELSLGAGTYYFYLAYETASTATAGHVLGATVTSFTMTGVTTPTISPNAAGTQTVVAGSACTYSIVKFPDLNFCSGVYNSSAAQTVNFNLVDSSTINAFNGGQTNKTMILSLPPGFAFAAGAQTVTFNTAGTNVAILSDITAANLTAVVAGATSITVTISTNNTNPGANFENINFNNFQIYPTAPGSGDLVRTAGTFSVDGSTSNPTTSQSFGHMLAGTALEYSSSAVKQYDTTAAVTDTCNNTPYGILEVQVNVTDPCGPATVTQFNFSTAGNPGSTAPTTDITKAEVYYTGQTQGLNFGTWFGSVATPNGAFAINGSVELDQGAGTYYFYLVYAIPKTAVAGDQLDGSMTSFVIDGVTETNMSTPNPSGSRMITTGTCSPTLNSESPTPNLQTINAGSLVIPMDDAHQSLYTANQFNLRAYGLIHELLLNNIPVMWVIKSGKTQDAPDFIASAGRAYPTVVAAATQTFVASEFIVDVSNLAAATSVITTFEAGMGKSKPMVAVYTLSASVPNVDVRYTLNAQPKIAVFSNGGYEGLQQSVLDTARIKNYVIENAGNFGGLSSCYTFCSEAHWEYEAGNPVQGNLAPVSNVVQFVAEGGNFLAQCAGIDLYENHQPGGGHFITTEGISFQNSEITNVSYAPDMAYSQFQTNGGVTVTQPNSLIGMFWPKPSSVYKPEMYCALGTSVAPTTTNTVIATGAHLAHPDSVGSNVFYLSGHSYATNTAPGAATAGDINGARLYLNATLIPAKRPTAFLAQMIYPSPNTVCMGTTFTLGGNPTGPAGATYTWASSAGGGLNSTTVANPTATPIAAGTYTYYVSVNNNGCPGTGTYTVVVAPTPTISAGSNQTICAGSTATLTGTTNQAGGRWSTNGQGSFSPVAANTLTLTYTPAGSDIPSGTTATTVTFTLTTIDTYTNCVAATSTTTLTILPVPIASVGAVKTMTICASAPTFTISGTATNGTGTWTSSSGNTAGFSVGNGITANEYTLSNTDITNQKVTLYLSVVGNGACGTTTAKDSLMVTITPQPIASVGAVKSMTVCASAPTFTISGTATNGTGTWTSSSGNTAGFSVGNGITANEYTLSSTDITNQKVTLYLSVVGTGACGTTTAKDSLTVTITPQPIASVGAVKSMTVCASAPTFTISGTATNGTGTWTSSSGNTAGFSVGNGITANEYTLSSTDITNQKVTLYLSVVGTGACGTTTAKDSLTVTITPQPIASVGAVKSMTVCASAPTFTISGTATNGTGTWTSSSGNTAGFSVGNGITASEYTLSSTDITNQKVTLYLSVVGTGACGTTTAKDSLTVTITPQPIASVGAVKSMTVCASAPTFTISGTATNGTGTWTSSSGNTAGFSVGNGITASEYTLSNADITAQTVTLYLSVVGNGACGTTTAKDSLTVTVTPLPIASVGAVKSMTVCANAIPITISGTAKNGTGVWSTTNSSDSSGTFSPNNTDSVVIFSCQPDSVSQSIAIYWTVSGIGVCGSSTAKDSLILTITPLPIASVGAVKSMTVCASAPTFTISGTATNGTGTWSSSGTGVFSPNTSISATNYTLSNADAAAHSIKLYLSVTGIGNCGTTTAKDSLTINITPQPVSTLKVGSDTTVCSNRPLVKIAGSVSNAVGTWSTYDGTGAFISDNTLANATTYSLSPADTILRTVHLVLNGTGLGVCSSYTAKDTMTINITPQPSSTLKMSNDTTVCSNRPMVPIHGSVNNGVGIWSTYDGTGTFSLDNTVANATSYSLSLGDTMLHTVHLVLNATGLGACNSYIAKDTLTINTTPQPRSTLKMSNDTSICANVFVVPIKGVVVNGTGIWSTYDGTGKFSLDSTIANATQYTLSNADTTLRTVHLVLNAIGLGACNTYTAKDTLTIKTSPTPNVSVGAKKSIAVCSNSDSISLKGRLGGATGVIWTTSGTGNFANSTDTTTVYKYSNADTAMASITLKITTTGNGACNPVKDSLLIAFNMAPQAHFTSTANPPVCLNQATTFTSGSSGIVAINQYKWQFGDGSAIPPSSPSVLYTYTLQGVYTASLTVVDANGCRDSITQNAIVHSLPVANFSSTAHCYIDSVYFKDHSTIPPIPGDTEQNVAWQWNFGNGAPSNLENPGHLYPGPGAYLAVLTVTSNYGCIGVAPQTLNVSPSPVAKFATDSVCFNNATLFVDETNNNLPLGAGTVNSWKLYYGDNTADSTTLNATTVQTTHTYSVYPVSGSYTATLIVGATNGCSDTVTEPVVIHPLPVPNIGYTTVCLADSTHFTATGSTISSGSIVGWKWDFGDGGVFVTTQNPLHKYAAVGTYGVSLKEVSNYSCTATTSKALTIDPSPTAAFSANPSVVQLSSAVQFTDNSTGSNINLWNWNFGDTTTAISSLKNPSYIYKLKGGVFTAKLVVTNTSLCSDSVTKQIIVEMPPKVPNAITPNGDGINDVLYVLGGPYIKLEFRVVDNWGDFIFYSNDQSVGWDGTKDGVKQPMGVYLYTIIATTPDNVQHTTYGDVTLIR